MVLIRVRHGLRRFLVALDSEGVGLFQAIVYLHVVIAGMYGLLVAGGVPQAVEEAMGHAVNAVWLWLCLGAGVCLAGKLLMRLAANVGMWMQLCGDVAALGAFASYVLATLQTSAWGKALFAVFVIAALTDCALLLVVRDVRRIVQVERQVFAEKRR